jgi:long-chain acyl-CoA synthetase
MRQTLLEVFFERTTGPIKERTYLRYKTAHGEPYRDMSFLELRHEVERVFAGLVTLGIKRGDRIAMVSESRPEWMITEYAALALGAIVVPMFPTLTAQQVEFIVRDSGARILIASNDLQLGKAIKAAAAIPTLEAVIVMNDELKTVVPSSISLLHFRKLGRAEQSSAPTQAVNFEEEAGKAKGDDLVLFIYTSGTTGDPKGVMLSHKNILANVEGVLSVIPQLTENDVALSFLPLCHAFEHIAMHFFMDRGMTVAFAESVDTVADNLLEIRPTIMTGVPRFYERVHTRIMRMREKLSPTRRALFDWALRIGGQVGRKMEGESVPIIAKLLHPIADLLVLKKIRARTGGRIRFFVSGAAALPAGVGRAFAAFGLTIIEGYGLTEASPVLSVNPWTHVKWGTVGKPITNVEMKLAEDGEILARGPNIMCGYYNQPQAKSEMIDSEGWLHTGDVGMFDEHGYLKITDRKKHIFVSTGGKNISPAPVEGLLVQSRYIDQVMLIGDKRQFCTALIVPDFAALKEDRIGIGPDQSSEALAMNEDVRSAIAKELDRLQSGLASFERARKFHLLPEQFTVENGMMTPTLKIKRKEVERRYAELIDSLYQLRPSEVT